MNAQVQEFVEDDKKMTLAIYALYLASFVIGFTLVIGAALAYWRRSQTGDPIWISHYENALLTALVVVGAVIAGFILGFVFLGWIAWLAGAVFLLYRTIMGGMAAMERKAYR